MCSMHLSRKQRTGTTDSSAPRFKDPETSFQYRTMPVTESGCLIWTGTTDLRGYGQIRIDGRQRYAHRYAWERANGPIPDSMVIDHLCHTIQCCNIDHLRLVTQGQNMQNRRGAQPRNKSGIRGVYWDNTREKWVVKIGLNWKHHFGGYFTDREEAGRVAAEMRGKLMTHSQN